MTDTGQRVTEWEPLVRELREQNSMLQRQLDSARELISDLEASQQPPTDSTWVKWKVWLRDIARSPHAMNATARFEAYLTRRARSEGD